MQHRASFIMMAIGQMLITVLEFVIIRVLFDRFGNLQGWSLYEVALFYGLINISYALAEGIARGFDTFHESVKSGEFDRILLRPQSTVLQIIGQELQLRRIGRLGQGLIILLWASISLDLAWTPEKVLLTVAAIAAGVCLFVGILILQAALCFWTTETLEVMNVLTHGGVFAAQYPLSIYRSWFREFFTYVVPLGCVGYYPALAILERSDPHGSDPLMALAGATGSCRFSHPRSEGVALWRASLPLERELTHSDQTSFGGGVHHWKWRIWPTNASLLRLEVPRMSLGELGLGERMRTAGGAGNTVAKGRSVETMTRNPIKG